MFSFSFVFSCFEWLARQQRRRVGVVGPTVYSVHMGVFDRHSSGVNWLKICDTYYRCLCNIFNLYYQVASGTYLVYGRGSGSGLFGRRASLMTTCYNCACPGVVCAFVCNLRVRCVISKLFVAVVLGRVRFGVPLAIYSYINVFPLFLSWNMVP